MPLTDFQREILALLAPGRSEESYLAGGAALHFAANSIRYTHDLDLFHDAEELAAKAFEADRRILVDAGFELVVGLSQPGFIRATVSRAGSTTQIDWARDSAWRFMPVVRDSLGGFLLHEVDLATNKVLALAGRDEVRDFVDILFVMERILPLGPLIWASVAKDPGFTPLSLLEQLRRRGRNRQEEVERLDLVKPFDLVDAKRIWLAALESAEVFVEGMRTQEVGCLFYDAAADRFVEPDPKAGLAEQGLVCHFCRPAGILPKPADQRISGG